VVAVEAMVRSREEVLPLSLSAGQAFCRSSGKWASEQVDYVWMNGWRDIYATTAVGSRSVRPFRPLASVKCRSDVTLDISLISLVLTCTLGYIREYLLNTHKIGRPPLFWSDQQRINQSLQKKSEACVAPCSVPCVCLFACSACQTAGIPTGGTSAEAAEKDTKMR
jgi:hypothetical protein